MPDNAVIQYQLAPYSVSQHLFKVSIQIPAHQHQQLTLTMPAWIPGSYMIRDFAKNISLFDANDQDGNPVAWQKTDKQTWLVDSGGKTCCIEYLVYAFDLSVRSAYMNDEYGFINGTSAFLCVQECSDSVCDVSLERCEESVTQTWRVSTGLPTVDIDADGYGHYTAENYAALIDYPILFGRMLETTFESDGIAVTMVYTGDIAIDTKRIADDLVPVLQQHTRLFDDKPPIDNYLFITLLADKGYGGLEHRNSTVLMFPRFDLPLVGEHQEKSKSYIDFLALCSHEFLHTWHVKRTRPAVFEQYQLDRESYTNQLWIYEGFTSLYDDLALARSGAITAQQYMEILGRNLTRLQRNPGRFKQSAAESSFDAWTRFYQQDANSINHIVSYYTKGAFIALCLDINLRGVSDGQYSLDDVMRTLWHEYGKRDIGTPDDVIHRIVQNLTGFDPTELLNSLVYLPGELPLASAFEQIGVQLHRAQPQSFDDVGGVAPSKPLAKTLGISVKGATTGVEVTQVRELGNGCQAGLQVGDLLIAVDQWQVNKDNLARLVATAQGTLQLTLLRDGRLLQLDCAMIAEHFETCYLTIEDEHKLNAWLGLI